MALAKKEIYLEGMYIDGEVLSKCDNLFAYIRNYYNELEIYFEKFKDYNKSINTAYLINYSGLSMPSSPLDNVRKSICTILKNETYKFDDESINNKIFRAIIENKLFDLIETVLDKIGRLQVIEGVNELPIDDFPYLLWLPTGDVEKYKKYKKYFYMERTYKYKINHKSMYFDKLGSIIDKFDLLKQFFKHQHMLSYYINLKIDDDEIEKFLRSILQNNSSLVKHYISLKILSIDSHKVDKIEKYIRRYHNIIYNIADFNWCYKFPDTVIIF